MKVSKEEIAQNAQAAKELAKKLNDEYVQMCRSLYAKPEDPVEVTGGFLQLKEFLKKALAELLPTKEYQTKLAKQATLPSPSGSTLRHLRDQAVNNKPGPRPLIVKREKWNNDYCVFITEDRDGYMFGHAYRDGLLYDDAWFKEEGEAGFFEYDGPSKSKIIDNEKALVKAILAKHEKPQEPSCDSCIYQKKGDCVFTSLCGDYVPVPVIPKSIIENWPKYGDATGFKIKNGKQ